MHAALESRTFGMGSRRSRKNRRFREKAQAPSAESPPVSSLPQQETDAEKKSGTIWMTLLLIVAAWLFAFLLRQHWVDLARANPAFVTSEGKLLPTTNDSYYFAATLENWDTGNLTNVVIMPDIYQHGMITMLPALLMKLFGFTADEIMIHMPIYIGGLLAVPLVLIGRLYGSLAWGFAAALLAVGAHSYFNRTIAGYFDTDMFSVLVPMTALYFMLAAYRRESLKAALGVALCLFLYPLFYQSGIPVAYAMGVAFVGWQFLADTGKESKKILSSFSCKPLLDRWQNNPFTWQSSAIVLVSLFFLESSLGHAVANHPFLWILKVGFIIGLYFLFHLKPLKLLHTVIITGVLAVGFLFLVAPVGKVIAKTKQYLPVKEATGVAAKKSGPAQLYFKDVIGTVQEAQKQENLGRNVGIISRRIIGSMPVCLLAVVGYIVLVIRRPEFLMALPLVGIGLYSLWGGYRFTIYAGPIAALALTHGFFLAFQKPWDHLIRAALGLAVAGGLLWGSWAVAQAEIPNPPKFTFNEATQKISLVQAKGHELESGLPMPWLAALLGLIAAGMVAWLSPARRSWLSVAVVAGVMLTALWLARFMMYDTLHRWMVEVSGFYESLPVWSWKKTGWWTIGLLVATFIIGRHGIPFYTWSGPTPKDSKKSGTMWASGIILALGFGATALLLLPNYRHALEYNKAMSTRPSVLQKGSVMALEKLKKLSRPGDYVLTWWDWGTAVWHHAGRNVICHPGHQSHDMFVVAKMLSSRSPLQAANLGRSAVEAFAKDPPGSMSENVIQGILTKDSFEGPDAVLESMASPKFQPPEPTQGKRDIYLFLPANLLQILPVIRSFSERDLATGNVRNTGLYQPLEQVSFGRDVNGTTPIIISHKKQPTYQLNPNTGQMVHLKSIPPETLFNLLERQPYPDQAISEAERFHQFEMSLRAGHSPQKMLGAWWVYQACAVILKGQANALMGRLAKIEAGHITLQPIKGPGLRLPRAEVERVHPVFLLNTTDVIMTYQKGTQYHRDFKHFRHPNAGFEHSNLHITLSTEFGTCLAVDNSVYFSNAYQMLVLGVYDKRVFEPVNIPTMYDRGQMNVTRIYKLLR